jgi:hypothetical protein
MAVDMATVAAARVEWRREAPVYLAGAAAVTPIVSVAAYQILVAIALVAMVAAGMRLRWPPVMVPIAAWAGWTLVSIAFSQAPAAGWPQVRKLYVFLMLVVIYTAVRTLRQSSLIALGWAAAATLAGAWSFVQFAQKYRIAQATNQQFYFAYVTGERTTGFVGHWMTFSGLLMMALLMIGALLLFAREL